MSWRSTKLGQIMTLQRGFDLPLQSRRPGMVPVVSSSGTTGTHDTAAAAPPGVVTGRYGTIGEVFWLGEPYWPLNTALFVKDYHGNDPRYCYYLLKTIDFESVSDKSGVPGVNRNDLHDFDVDFVEHLDEQKSVAAVLRVLDDKIDLNRKINQTLDSITRALFKSWFVEFDPVVSKMEGRQPFGMDGETAALFPGKFQESELGPIPKGWMVGCVADLCEFIETGGTPSRQDGGYWVGGDVPWFKTGELQDGPLLMSEETIATRAIDETNCKIWQPGTILFAIYASPTLGRMGVLEVPGTCNQASAALGAKKSVGRSYLYGALLEAREELQAVASGAAQQNINLGILREHKVLVPSAECSSAFSQMTDPWYRLVASNAAEVISLTALRNVLLPKLLSGELRLKDAENLVSEAI